MMNGWRFSFFLVLIECFQLLSRFRAQRKICNWLIGKTALTSLSFLFIFVSLFPLFSDRFSLFGSFLFLFISLSIGLFFNHVQFHFTYFLLWLILCSLLYCLSCSFRLSVFLSLFTFSHPTLKVCSMHMFCDCLIPEKQTLNRWDDVKNVVCRYIFILFCLTIFLMNWKKRFLDWIFWSVGVWMRLMVDAQTVNSLW